MLRSLITGNYKPVFLLLWFLVEVRKILNNEVKKITVTKFEELARQFKPHPDHLPGSKDVVNFLKNKNKCQDLERQKLSTTFLILNDNLSIIFGFFTFVMKELDLSKTDMTPRSLRKLVGSSFNKDDKSTWRVQTLLIAHFARNFDSKAKNFTGPHLWRWLYEKMGRLGINFRTIALDCAEELIPYYQRYDFKKVKYSNIKKLYTLIKKNDVEEVNQKPDIESSSF